MEKEEDVIISQTSSLSAVPVNAPLEDPFLGSVRPGNEPQPAFCLPSKLPLDKKSCPLCFPADGKLGMDDYVLCAALDGNNSLKRRDRPGTAYQDHQSHFRLTSEYVNQFAGQTISAQRTGPSRTGQATSKPAAKDSLGPCSSHWTAAKERPRASLRYDEMGWFPLICRHGVVLAYTDMIKEHENAKFPLALVKWLGERYSGRISFGYDIGCSFAKTFQHAPLLSRLAKSDSRIQFRESPPVPAVSSQSLISVIWTDVGAWHGYAHNRECQVRYHPRLTSTAGLEDFEGCERLFSYTNGIAGVTRSATRYHRHQQLEWVIKQWNSDKLLHLGQFAIVRQTLPALYLIAPS